MSLYNIVSPASLVPGQPEDVSQVLANFQAIQAVLNGGIDDVNIRSTAAMSPSKLSGYPADATKALFGDGSWKKALDLTNTGTQVASGQIQAAGGFQVVAVGTTYAYVAWPTGNTNPSWICRNDGAQYWSAASGPPNDTNLYRPTAATLKTDGTLYVGAVIQCDGPVYANVFGNRAIIGSLPSAGSATGLGLGATGGGTVDTMWYRNAPNTLACWNTSFGTIQAAAFTVSSDRQKKSAIRKVKVDHEKLLGASIYSYRRDDTKERHIGLMADELPDEVVSVLPGGGDDDGDMQFVDLYKLTTAMLSVIQELHSRVAELESSG